MTVFEHTKSTFRKGSRQNRYDTICYGQLKQVNEILNVSSVDIKPPIVTS